MARNLRTVAEEEEIPTFGPEPSAAPAPPTAGRTANIAREAVFLALRALSQRALTALASLTDLTLVGSAFALWVMVIKEPTVFQLVGVGLYAGFVFATLLVRRRG